MTTTINWLGHNAWSIETGGKTILVDPFLNDSPTAPLKADHVKADFILLSHGHADHVGDTIAIAKRTGAPVIANFEVTEWLKKKGVADDKVVPMNPGGGREQPFGHVKFTIAHHSSSMPDGSYGGVPGGFLLTLPGARVYFACDTALFYDMKLIGEAGIDVAILPVGDNFTMDPDDALRAVKLIEPKRVIPDHYNTWPLIAQEVQSWADRVRAETSTEPVILKPGESCELG